MHLSCSVSTCILHTSPNSEGHFSLLFYSSPHIQLIPRCNSNPCYLQEFKKNILIIFINIMFTKTFTIWLLQNYKNSSLCHFPFLYDRLLVILQICHFSYFCTLLFTLWKKLSPFPSAKSVFFL